MVIPSQPDPRRKAVICVLPVHIDGPSWSMRHQLSLYLASSKQFRSLLSLYMAQRINAFSCSMRQKIRQGITAASRQRDLSSSGGMRPAAWLWSARIALHPKKTVTPNVSPYLLCQGQCIQQWRLKFPIEEL